MSKKLIEICLNLTDSKKTHNDNFDSSGLIILESFLIEKNKFDYFMENTIPIITNSIFNDYKSLKKELKFNDKIKKNDIVIRISDFSNIDFKFLT